MIPSCFAKAQKFQSLIGFKINWNSLIPKRFKRLSKFQSLIGFKINWNDFGHLRGSYRVLCFNP